MKGLTVMRKSMSALVLLPALLAVCLPAKAQLALVTSRPALAGDDSVNWGVLGSSFIAVGSPFNINSVGGNTLTVSQDGNANFERRDQGNGWNGNFAPREQLLWDENNGPTMTMEFAQAVAGVGAQIQADVFGAFTAKIEAFDALNNSLGSFTENGNSTANGDGSAIFLGVVSAAGDIKKITYSLTSAAGQQNDFAINKMDLTTSVVPEGDSLAMLACGGVPFMFLVVRKSRKRSVA